MPIVNKYLIYCEVFHGQQDHKCLKQTNSDIMATNTTKVIIFKTVKPSECCLEIFM